MSLHRVPCIGCGSPISRDLDLPHRLTTEQAVEVRDDHHLTCQVALYDLELSAGQLADLERRGYIEMPAQLSGQDCCDNCACGR